MASRGASMASTRAAPTAAPVTASAAHAMPTRGAPSRASAAQASAAPTATSSSGCGPDPRPALPTPATNAGGADQVRIAARCEGDGTDAFDRATYGCRGQGTSASRRVARRSSPIPSTSWSWSIERTLPFSSRYSMIAAASTGPIPSTDASSCSGVAWARLIGAASAPAAPVAVAGRGGPGRAGRRGRRDLAAPRHHHLLTVLELRGQVHARQLGPGGGAAGPVDRRAHPGAARHAVQPFLPHGPRDVDVEPRGVRAARRACLGRGILDLHRRRRGLLVATEVAEPRHGHEDRRGDVGERSGPCCALPAIPCRRR